ncbi:E3 ubiquitin-protein ligase DTX3L-like [Acipenser ruthenus]|uniref:E3 ubiquitin-protein ligase DTX3L-like n=1 Tax=Acipenser ruthenus TaxID=7906 RepID=UPI002741F02F|nr:E3 ubiquitin-protein ligase DTX3L-like [Acipenser ruthenus]XP_058869006.1 E3 ubiquitin-protein ligase DTX3L-like [Acipenser ruthenus]
MATSSNDDQTEAMDVDTPQDDSSTDTGKAQVHIKVESTNWNLKDKKPWATLEKKLQTFCSKLSKGAISVLKIDPDEQDPRYATAEVTPSSAVGILLEQKPFKVHDLSCEATVHFLNKSLAPADHSDPPTDKKKVQIPLKVGAQLDLNKLNPEAAEAIHVKYKQFCSEDGKVTVQGSFEEVDQFHKDILMFHLDSKRLHQEQQQEMEHEARTNLETEAEGFEGKNGASPKRDMSKNGEDQVPAGQTIPMSQFHYDYLTKAYRREIEDIKQSSGVEMNSEVIVSFSPAQGKEEARVQKAGEDFIHLYQNAATSLGSVKIPLSSEEHGRLQDDFKEMQSSSFRFVLNKTEDGYNLVGPQQDLQRVQKELMSRLSGTAKKARSELIEIHYEEQLMKKDLEMYHVHWKFINQLYSKQLQRIQEKFGVKIDGQPVSGSQEAVKLEIKQDKGSFNLQSHAFHAFLELYQKVATGLMSRSVEDASEAQNAKKLFKEICPNHPNVWEDEQNVSLKLVGFVNHLAPAVLEMETNMGKKVFKGEELVLKFLTSATGGPDTEEENCPICLSDFTEKTLLKCKHAFCKGCLDQAMATNPMCPVCKAVFGKVEGNQPPGKMTWHKTRNSLPGFHCGTIEISYDIPSGIQTEKHPNPGRHFSGTARQAYLPDNAEGEEVLRLLKKAFNQKLIFTVGTSRTSGAEDTVTWNDIHHKTRIHGGPQGFGYPDPDYLKRVKEELKDKGIE